MHRDLMTQLETWKSQSSRKPLILRGARQVGKTHLIRKLAKTHYQSIFEINFEKKPQYKKIFEGSLEPKEILRNLQLLENRNINLEQTLIFFDEVQECPQAITALRYLYEDFNGKLHVVAAGSLLEFALEKVGVPVGRIDYLHLYPLSFSEYLKAAGFAQLAQELENNNLNFSSIVHEQLLKILADYLFVGGMPEACVAWFKTQKPVNVQHIHQSLVTGFRQDFLKYAKRNQMPNVETVFEAIPKLLGKKFVFSHVNRELKSRDLKAALQLLKMAQIAHLIPHSSGAGIPLAANQDSAKFKVLLVDVALSQTLLMSPAQTWLLNAQDSFINKGSLVESFVGQELLAYSDPQKFQSLHYWIREAKSSSAEVDYLLEQNSQIIPIEVKAGVSGRQKSLNIFLEEKNHISEGVLFSKEKFHKKNKTIYLPLYAVRTLFQK